MAGVRTASISAFAGVMYADDIDHLCKVSILNHRIGDLPVGVATDNLDCRVPGYKRGM